MDEKKTQTVSIKNIIDGRGRTLVPYIPDVEVLKSTTTDIENNITELSNELNYEIDLIGRSFSIITDNIEDMNDSLDVLVPCTHEIINVLKILNASHKDLSEYQVLLLSIADMEYHKISKLENQINMLKRVMILSLVFIIIALITLAMLIIYKKRGE